MADGYAICCECGGEVYLHTVECDGMRILTGRCPNCRTIHQEMQGGPSEEAPRDPYAGFEGEGQNIVIVRYPGQKEKGFRFKDGRTASKFAMSLGPIPYGGVSFEPDGPGYPPSWSMHWPHRLDEADYARGRIDAAKMLIRILKTDDRTVNIDRIQEFCSDKGTEYGRGAWHPFVTVQLGCMKKKPKEEIIAELQKAIRIAEGCA